MGGSLNLEKLNIKKHPALEADFGKNIDLDLILDSPNIKGLLKKKMAFANYMSKIQSTLIDRLKQNPIFQQLKVLKKESDQSVDKSPFEKAEKLQNMHRKQSLTYKNLLSSINN